MIGPMDEPMLLRYGESNKKIIEIEMEPLRVAIHPFNKVLFVLAGDVVAE